VRSQSSPRALAHRPHTGQVAKFGSGQEVPLSRICHPSRMRFDAHAAFSARQCERMVLLGIGPLQAALGLLRALIGSLVAAKPARHWRQHRRGTGEDGEGHDRQLDAMVE